MYHHKPRILQQPKWVHNMKIFKTDEIVFVHYDLSLMAANQIIEKRIVLIPIFREEKQTEIVEEKKSFFFFWYGFISYYICHILQI